MSRHLAECKTLFTQDEGDCDCFSLHRVAIIEECARVAENVAVVTDYGREKIAAAIRALKEKP